MDQLGPVSAPLGLRCAEVPQRSERNFFFSAGERELINLTVERQHRCADIKAVRAQIQMKEGAGAGYRCFWLPVSLWRRGQGSNGEIGGKHI